MALGPGGLGNWNPDTLPHSSEQGWMRVDFPSRVEEQECMLHMGLLVPQWKKGRTEMSMPSCSLQIYQGVDWMSLQQSTHHLGSTNIWFNTVNSLLIHLYVGDLCDWQSSSEPPPNTLTRVRKAVNIMGSVARLLAGLPYSIAPPQWAHLILKDKHVSQIHLCQLHLS